VSRHSLGQLQALQLGRVVDNVDPDNRGRVKVLILALELEVWASLVTPSAGAGYGIACPPKLEEIVVLAFVGPELPLVLGSLWSGTESAPEDADPAEDNYCLRTPAGSVVRLDDGAEGPRLLLTTPAGYKLEIKDSGGGEILIERGSERVSLSAGEISVQSSGNVSVTAGGQLEVNAAMVTVNAGMSRFSGVVQADTVISNAVVGTSYTPGAGNIW
jgi:uncharacterized protein involved in type VI secretion and phage assembly